MLTVVAMSDTHGYHGHVRVPEGDILILAGDLLAQRWAQIPEDTDILITHGPPLGFGDRVDSGEHVGCEDLLRRVQQVRPKLHLFGHIHESRASPMSPRTSAGEAPRCCSTLPFDQAHCTPEP